MATFGETLRELREKRNMSQPDLAEKLGVGRESISNYENDKASPKYDKLLIIADLFNVTTDFLLGRKDAERHFFDKHEQATLTEDDVKRIKFLKDMEEILRQSSDLNEDMIAHSLRIMEVTFLEKMGKNRK